MSSSCQLRLGVVLRRLSLSPYIWWLYGLLESIVSDRGPQFAAGVMKKLNKILGIETKLLAAYYLQTDRQMERVNQELEQYLHMFIDHRQEQWPE